MNARYKFKVVEFATFATTNEVERKLYEMSADGWDVCGFGGFSIGKGYSVLLQRPLAEGEAELRAALKTDYP